MKMTFGSFDKSGLSIEARRNALMGKYGKKAKGRNANCYCGG